mmetsp:Transcript_4655/g.14067  ORF Transcript_4655/g.14067 Transcript_4655/m.14067 type:complete len:752 (-) Transcript_4655:467-2722(-)
MMLELSNPSCCWDSDIDALRKRVRSFLKEARETPRTFEGFVEDVWNNVDKLYDDPLVLARGGLQRLICAYELKPETAESLLARECVEITPHFSEAAKYRDTLHRLLWMEELAQRRSRDASALLHMTLTLDGTSVAVHVPGLSESKLTMPGQAVRLTFESDGAPVECVGRVKSVDNDSLIVKYKTEDALEIKHVCQGNGKFDVYFLLDRTSLRFAHHGVDLFDSGLQKILFPNAETLESAQLCGFRCNTDNLRLPGGANLEQERAVSFIRSMVQHTRAKPWPMYIVYGPPGTGKTHTLAQAVATIVEDCSCGRILLCTPSNAAADNIACKVISGLGTDAAILLRVMARSRSPQDTPPSLLPYTQGVRMSDPPEFRQFKYRDFLSSAAKIFVLTVSSAAKFACSGLPPGFFDLIVVDEAGQASEPEILGVLSCLYNDRVNVVLAGDPQQLGPVLMSKAAERHGLGKSLLERLLQRSPYRRSVAECSEPGGYDPHVATKLVRNYRAHPELLRVPNELFYEAELIAAGDKAVINSLCEWQDLPASEVPLIFHGIVGEEMQRPNSPSWFNMDEAHLVLGYVRKLVELADVNAAMLCSKDIAVITPYEMQRKTIAEMLERDESLKEVQVGSVEKFQGCERKVIVVSTVRSSVVHSNTQDKHKLGFVAQRKRFNVAVTRAQALLIVIGNPFLLCIDRCWDHLLQHCVRLGAYVGCEWSTRNRAEHLQKLSGEDRMELTAGMPLEELRRVGKTDPLALF